MSEEKTYVFGDNQNGNILSALAPLLQQRGVDPSVLAMMNNGGFGNNGSWFVWILFLALIGWGGNGFGGWGNSGMNGAGFLSNQINNNEGRDLLMQAIQGNKDAVGNLATTLNTDFGIVNNAISNISTQLCNIGNQVGLTAQQTINALQAGNMQLAQQIANASAQSQLGICQQTNALQTSICDAKTTLNNSLTNLSFQNERQSCDIKGVIRDSTDKIVAGQTAAEMREMQAIINRQSDELQSYKTAGIISQQIAPLGTALANLQNEFTAFQSKQPVTYPVQYQPFIAVPNGVAAAYGYGSGYNFSNSGFWGA